MVTAGIICEFDPFHNGHLYLLETARKELKADRIVCVMSGSFTQRGKPAGWDKFARARAAAACGADLVLELPFAYAVNFADLFARGGVRVLDRLGCVDYLVFGSECGDTERLKNAAEQALKEGGRQSIKEQLSSGEAYAKAVTTASSDPALFEEPNDTLAVCYIKELIRQNSCIKPYAVKRLNAMHGAVEALDGFASGSYIRDLAAKTGSLEAVKDLIPEKAYKELSVCSVWTAEDEERLFAIVRSAVLRSSAEDIACVPEVSEGLENRIKACVCSAADMDSFIKGIKSKRYTYARVARALMQFVCGFTKADLELFEKEEACYAKVLAFNSNGASVLKDAAAKSSIDIISNVNKASVSSAAAQKMLELDIKAADMYSIIKGRPIDNYSDKICVPTQIK